MKRIGILLSALVVAAGVSGCSGKSATGPSADEITGAWRATKVEYVSHAGGASVDLIAAGGSATLELGADGTFRFTVDTAGDPPETLAGSWRLDGDVMTVRPQGRSFDWQFDVEFTGAALRLTGASVEFDVDGDDRDEEADLNLEFVR